ncbi:sodium/metabolite symporter [Chloropicon primus]|nr:sodium/metabolite symporter [Chloropicon primus]
MPTTKGFLPSVSPRCSVSALGQRHLRRARDKAVLALASRRSERRTTPINNNSRPVLLAEKQQEGVRGSTLRAANSSPKETESRLFQTYLKVSNVFANLFPIWTVAAAAAGLANPSLFSWLTTSYFTAGLGILMFSMGITLTLQDFKRVLSKPGPVTINFLCCYVLMPLLGLALGKAFALSPPIVAGLVLVGSINGGQASNLCTYIARGDVALSVVMTTSTTLGTIFMTPLIAKVLLGTIVPVDAVGVAVSAMQVVLLPIILGVCLNSTAPKFCRQVEPLCPTIGVTSTVLLVGASVAGCAQAIKNAGWGLQIVVMLLHLIGGAAGYWLCRICKFGETTSRTTAIETAMKSSAFGVLLATLHFGDYLVRVPSAVSVVWMAIMGSSMAVVWQFIPVKGE